MAEITVDFEDYVSESDIAEMVRDAVRYQIKEKARYVVDYYGYDTLINNVAYETVRQMLDEHVRQMLDEQGLDINEMLTESVKKVIDKLSEYTVFYDGAEYNSYGAQSKYKSHGRVVMNEVIDELRPEIKDKVHELMVDKLDADWLIDAAVDAFKKELSEQLSGN